MEDHVPIPEATEEVMAEAVAESPSVMGEVLRVAGILQETAASYLEPSTVIETSTTTTCETETIPPLSLPTPLQPIFSTPNALISPLFVLAVAMIFLSLLFAQKFSRSPLQQIGQVGPRGRKYHSWNESTTGGCGGRFIDWWIFGGSVWIRAALCLWDGMAGTHSSHGDNHHESSGENLFACFGVAGNKADENAAGADAKKEGEFTHDDHALSSTGIFGFDSSLGGFGPICLAPIRASVFLIGWCSVCSFLKISYNELVDFATKLADPASAGYFQQIPSIYREKIGNVAVSILYFIQEVMNLGNDLVEKKSDALEDAWLPTIAYAIAFIFVLEFGLYHIGRTCMLLKIYRPMGVSHPGGARPHKIVHKPQ